MAEESCLLLNLNLTFGQAIRRNPLSMLQVLEHHTKPKTGFVFDHEIYYNDFTTFSYYAMFVAYFALVFIVGLTGNILTIVLVLTEMGTKSVSNIYLLSISMADLMNIVLGSPGMLLQLLSFNWLNISRELYFICPLREWLSVFMASSTSYTLVAISVERYFSICRPLSRSAVKSRSSTKFVITLIWLLSVVVGSMALKFSVDDSFTHQAFKTCRVNMLAEHVGAYVREGVISEANYVMIFAVRNTIMFFIVPVAVLSVTYGVVSHALWNTVKNTKENIGTKKADSKTSNRIATAKMLVTISLAYAIFWLPMCVLQLYVAASTLKAYQLKTYSYSRFVPKIGMNERSGFNFFFAVGYLFAYGNSSINPIIYALMSSKFLNGYFKLFFRREKKH